MNIGINGFGKVGQALLHRLSLTEEIDVVAINENLLSVMQAATLLDSTASVTASGDLVYGQKTIKWLTLSDHRKIGWEKYGIDVVVEASRLFLRREMEEQSADGRITVLMTGDLRDELPDLTLVLGVNENEYHSGVSILCAGSDRTQALVPILRAIHNQCGVRLFRACIHRPPYAGNCGRVQIRPTNAEQLARVLPALTGCGEVTRVDDPEATYVTIWLDILVNVPADTHHVRAAMHELAASLPSAVLCSGESPAPVGESRSALIDPTSIKTETAKVEDRDEHHVWLRLCYDPVVSYAERIREQLLFLSRHRGIFGPGSCSTSPPTVR